MNALENNDVPDKDAGIKLAWAFVTDTTQFIFKNNITGEWCEVLRNVINEQKLFATAHSIISVSFTTLLSSFKEFIESCHQTAEEFPTSFYGAAMNGQSWTAETNINLVGGKSGWITTQVIKTISCDGRMRQWQWEMRKNKRPPCLGCWRVESIGSSDRNGDFEAMDRRDGWSD